MSTELLLGWILVLNKCTDTSFFFEISPKLEQLLSGAAQPSCLLGVGSGEVPIAPE